MVADSIESLQSVQTTSAPAAPEGVTTPIQPAAAPKIDFTDSDVKVTSSQPSTPVIKNDKLSLTTTPYINEGMYNTFAASEDKFYLATCNVDLDGVKRGAENNIRRITDARLGFNGRPIVQRNVSDAFGQKPEYALADFNYSVKDLKESAGVTKYFSIGQMYVGKNPILVVTNKETCKALNESEMQNFYTFASQTIELERQSKQPV